MNITQSQQYEKYNTETKTNLIPKYKPKTKNWQSPIVEKDDLIIEKNQKGPYTTHHDDDYLRLINKKRTQQKTNYKNAKMSDIFYDKKNKNNRELNQRNTNLRSCSSQSENVEKHNNKPHSVTMEIHGNKGLFANSNPLLLMKTQLL